VTHSDLNPAFMAFMAFKWAEANTTDWPPYQKIPGTAAGKVRKRHLLVSL